MRLALCTLGMIVTMSVSADDLLLTEDALDIEQMSETRGGTQVLDLDLTQISSDIDGISSGNVANNTVSGDNILSPGAFADSSGIASVIQNTGNNVLIQNSTVVNLTLK